MPKKTRTVFLLLAVSVILLTAALWTQGKPFSYSNLYDSQSQIFFRELMRRNGVPQECVDSLISQVNSFHAAPYRGLVKEGWKSTNSLWFSYRDKDGFTHLDAQPDNLLNCRITAFQIARYGISFEETNQTPAEAKDPKSRTVLSDPEDLLHYDLLFSNIDDPGIASSEELVRLQTEYWENAGISFSDSSIRLITACGASGQIIQNFHSAVAIYEEEYIWLFEKYDPIHPYQLSRFEDESDLITYMRRRLNGIEFAALFANDVCLWKRS